MSVFQTPDQRLAKMIAKRIGVTRMSLIGKDLAPPTEEQFAFEILSNWRSWLTGSVEKATIDAANYSTKLTESLEKMRGLIGAESDVEAMMRSHGYAEPEVPKNEEKQVGAEDQILGKSLLSAEKIYALDPWARDAVENEIKNKSWKFHKPTELWASPSEYERLSSALG